MKDVLKGTMLLKQFILVISLIVHVRAQSHAYDYGYATNVKQYTRRIQLKQGTLQGVVVEPRVNRVLPPVEQFLGIPYAAPPTRELRFMPPGSAPSWFGTKIADSFGPVCPQKLPEKSTMGPEREDYFAKLVKHLILNQSEDCLYLNIYAPVQDVDVPKPIYPVMVYLHGESYEWNSGNPYDGSVLAAYGKVIVVTINFRLGVFGFLRTGLDETASSNFGLVDQIAALLWVQNNIAAFGGNPNLVTLFGHGTGAVCANLLLLSPMVNGDGSHSLFKRAILMGGTALADWAFSSKPRYVTYQVAGSLNCPSSEAELANCLRTRNTNEIVNASVSTDYYATRFGPIIDSRVVAGDPRQNLAKYSDLLKRFELMYGVTEIESAHLLGPVGLTHGLLEKERDQELKRYLRLRCDSKPELCLTRTLEEYIGKVHDFPVQDQARGSFSEHGVDRAKLARDKLLEILSDARSLAPVVQMGKLHSVANPQSYFYVFGHSPSSKEHLRNKSVQGDELPYVFGIPLDGPKFHFKDHYTPYERLLSEMMMTYFSSFAYTGDPNVNRRTEFYNLSPMDWIRFEVEWPEYDIENEAYLYFALPPQVKFRYRDEQVKFWNEKLPNIMKEGPTVPTYYENWKTTTKPPKVTPPTPKTYPKLTKKPTVGPTLTVIDQPAVEPRVTEETDAEAKSGNATNLLVVVGCLFLLINIFVFAGLYYKCVRLKNKEKKRREEYGMPPMEGIAEKSAKVSEDLPGLDGCNLMSIIGKPPKSEDVYEAVKLSDDGSTGRFKLMRQMSSSTIDPHTKVRDWIAHEIVHRCSPRYLRRTRQQLADEHKAKQKQLSSKQVSSAIDSNSTLGQSPTRPVSPEERTTERSHQLKPSAIPVLKPAIAPKKMEKVSIAIDATPTGRGISIMRQQPIEMSKSLDYQHLPPVAEPILRRSFTMDDVNLPSSDGNLHCSSTSINLKQPLKIHHHHSRSDPIDLPADFFTSVKPCEIVDDVNVTSRDESEDKLEPLTADQQLLLIKRRNFPKVLPDFPRPSKEVIAIKRRSMPVPGILNVPIPEISSFSQPTSPSGKLGRLPPAPPPRTTSAGGKTPNILRVCDSPAALAEEPPAPSEPEVTFNNLYIGPLVPSTLKKQDPYKQSIQQIYEPLRPPKPKEVQEKKEPKTIISANTQNLPKRPEPKVVIKPTIAKKSTELLNKVGARVVARNSADEKYNQLKVTAPTLTREGDPKKPKPSQIPTLVKDGDSSPNKESISSESTPSEESDTGTVVKRV
ncbi:neuroligin-4, Y-linked isoform X1 [Photinus pyralis]|uniref:neuroligin-4, Y-linked isoform X1 n=1 Tax=Photinus pyralis TaxID=7054 RepID=UPI0012676E37|nr:neuroligin-4, Y-linked isoform X1 [Photinus pyralis]XP_031344431.1 neuroligin-4, Y-linked isoform X1 [Photinus pyralis]